MDIDSTAKKLMWQAEQNYKKYGFLAQVALLIMKDKLMILPPTVMKVFNDDREGFNEIVRGLVKETCPDAVAIICEAWIVESKDGKIEQPSTSPRRKECALLTIDTKDKQVTYISDIVNKKMSPWREFGVYDKLNPLNDNVRVSGNLVDFFCTGTSLNVPFELHLKPDGKAQDITKIDGE